LTSSLWSGLTLGDPLCLSLCLATCQAPAVSLSCPCHSSSPRFQRLVRALLPSHDFIALGSHYTPSAQPASSQPASSQPTRITAYSHRSLLAPQLTRTAAYSHRSLLHHTHTVASGRSLLHRRHRHLHRGGPLAPVGRHRLPLGEEADSPLAVEVVVTKDRSS